MVPFQTFLSISSFLQVRYTVDGFVEKNMETLSNELRDLGDSSTVELSKAVYECSGEARRSTIRGVTVAAQFKLSLQSLVDDLDQTQPHYIRCIKPNLKKSPNTFFSGEVLKQLRYSGMMEAIRIRQQGYALREDHESFYNRFSVLLNPGDLTSDRGIEQLVRVLSQRLNVTDVDWQIGHSKIFLRRELSEKLERLAKLRVHAAARTVGRFGKAAAHRRLSGLLVAWARFRLIMLKKYRTKRASTKISSSYRMHQQVKLYKSAIQAAIKIQALQRQLASVEIVRKLRDPYCDMTFKELKGLLTSETSRLEQVVNAKDFKAAADLEAKM
jgi:myosin heavy subunit